MSEVERHIYSEERIGDQPLGSDFDQTLLDFLEKEFARPEPAYRVIMGKFVPLWGMVKGLKMTGQAMLSRKFTVQYPEEKLEVADVFRGKHVLLTSPNSEQLCICCNACAMICPVDCISLKFEKDKDPDSKKRILTEYNVDLSKCLFCGLCQEQCPEFCIILGHDYEYSDTNREVGLLNVRKEDIERRATDEEWAQIQELKAAKKKPPVKKPAPKPTEDVKEDNKAGEEKEQ